MNRMMMPPSMGFGVEKLYTEPLLKSNNAGNPLKYNEIFEWHE